MSEVDVVDIDLDELRAVRLEALGRPRTLRLQGKVFEIPPEFQYAWLEPYNNDDGERLVREVLGTQAEEFLALATLDDIKAFGTRLFAIYGIGRGEPPASNGSSRNTGGRSRRTSNGSTGSTSGRRSGAKSASAG
jgi:hypothetical protein